MERIIADLVVRDAADKEAQLASALGIAIEEASRGKVCGVLLTRHHYSRFTVALSPKVPYGQTYELDISPIRAGSRTGWSRE
jgi:hypothetical protein